MRGDSIYEGLFFVPKRNMPEDKPTVPSFLRAGIQGKAIPVEVEAKDEYDFWQNTRYSKLSTIRMFAPITVVKVQRGYVRPETVERVRPIQVGNLEMLEEKQRRREAVNKTRQALGCG